MVLASGFEELQANLATGLQPAHQTFMTDLHDKVHSSLHP